MIAIDFETHMIAPGTLAPPIVCYSESDGRAPGRVLQRLAGVSRLTELLERGELLTGANIAYDFGCYLKAVPRAFELVWKAYEQGKVLDVLIASTLDAVADGRLVDGSLFLPDGKRVQSGRYSLATCVQQWLGRDDAKVNDAYRQRYVELDEVPLEQWPREALDYPQDDALNTWLVGKEISLRAQNLGDQPNQAWTAFCLHMGAVHGLKANPIKVAKLEHEIADAREQLRKELLSAGLFRTGGTRKAPKLVKDTKKIKALVQEAYGTPPVTATGATAIDRETLVSSGNPNLAKLGELSAFDKIVTYIPALKEAASTRLNTRPNILLATGRTSYEGVIQLMPKSHGIRECFEPDGLFVFADYAAIEMAGLAQVHLSLLGRSSLAEAINAGYDIHCLLGSQLINTSYEDFRARHKAGDPEIGDIRQAAKAANFGFPGMMGEATFVASKKKVGASVCEWFYRDGACKVQSRTRVYKDRALDVPLCVRCIRQAKQLRENYLTKWPEMKPYWDKVTLAMRKWNDRIPQLVSGRIRGGLTAPAAANTLFQGLVADGAKEAIRLITKELYLDQSSPLFGARLVYFAHDEIGLDVPRNVECARAAAKRLVGLMKSGMQKYIPDVRVDAEPVIMDCWSKKAKPLFNEQGELDVWRLKQ